MGFTAADLVAIDDVTDAADADFFGKPVSNAGDVNGDGFDHLIVEANAADRDDAANNSASYMIFDGQGGNATVGTVEMMCNTG